MNAAIKDKDPRDKWILRYFVMFFGVIALLDGIFVYIAVSTQTGVVIDRPYERGLAFNETLQKAKAQPDIKHKASYREGVLRWELPQNIISGDVLVTASILRPVQDGHDFDITLKHMGGGVYEARPEAPLSGMWTANLKVTWNNKKYQTSYPFMVE